MRSKHGSAEIKAGQGVLSPHAPEPQTLAGRLQESGDERSSSFLTLQVADTIRKSSTRDTWVNGRVTFYSLPQMDEFVGKGPSLSGPARADRDLQTEELRMMSERRTYVKAAPVGQRSCHFDGLAL